MIMANLVQSKLPIIIIIMVFVVLFGSFFIAFIYRPDEFHKTRLNVFLTSLAGIAIFLVGINIVLSSLSFEYNLEFTRMSKTKESIDKLWLYPNQLITGSHDARPAFLAGFYLNDEKMYKLAKNQDADQLTLQGRLQEENIAIVVIQSWEDFLTMQRVDETGAAVWLNNFIQWAQNPLLREYFDILKYNYKDSTIQLGELLFEYSGKLPIPTIDINLYQSTVDTLIKDPRFIALIIN